MPDTTYNFGVIPGKGINKEDFGTKRKRIKPKGIPPMPTENEVEDKIRELQNKIRAKKKPKKMKPGGIEELWPGGPNIENEYRVV